MNYYRYIYGHNDFFVSSDDLSIYNTVLKCKILKINSLDDPSVFERGEYRWLFSKNLTKVTDEKTINELLKIEVFS